MDQTPCLAGAVTTLKLPCCFQARFLRLGLGTQQQEPDRQMLLEMVACRLRASDQVVRVHHRASQTATAWAGCYQIAAVEQGHWAPARSARHSSAAGSAPETADRAAFGAPGAHLPGQCRQTAGEVLEGSSAAAATAAAARWRGSAPTRAEAERSGPAARAAGDSAALREDSDEEGERRVATVPKVPDGAWRSVRAASAGAAVPGTGPVHTQPGHLSAFISA